LPILPGFAPNQNENPQITNEQGKYGWMVYPDADYYVVAEKSGYQSYNSLLAKPNAPAASDSTSYIDNGVIHVGNSIVSLDLSIKQIPSDSIPDSSSGSSSGSSSDSDSDSGSDSDLDSDSTSDSSSDESPMYSDETDFDAVSEYPSASQDDPKAYNKYVSGYPDGMFRPNAEISRAEVAQMLYRALQLSDPVSDAPYPDVPENFWGVAAIAALANEGIMTGYPDGGFKPNEIMTRAEMAVIAVKMNHLEIKITEAPYSDTGNSWADYYIAAATKANFMQGYPDGTFKPDQSLTRAEAVATINRILGREPLNGKQQATWPDVAPDFWAYGDIEAASTDVVEP
jgi:hypothetical protein